MDVASRAARLEAHLRVLVNDVGPRPPGSPANARANAYVRGVLESAGLTVREHPFTTRWWEPGSGRLVLATGPVDVTPNPFSPPVDVRGPVVRMSRWTDLDDPPHARGALVVLDGELTREPVMPKAFPFFQPSAHEQLRCVLERAGPVAVIAVSDHWSPIFEDPDMPFASTTVPPEAGARLEDGAQAHLVLGGTVHEGEGSTLTCRFGDAAPRIVVSAHLDSKVTTPGAFDNAAAVAVLLTLAEDGLESLGAVEIVFFNGEDHFDACGEQAWLAAADLTEVAANVNLDGVGVAGRRTALAALSCPDHLLHRLDAFAAARDGWCRAEPWYESDHAIFALQGIPALALSTEDVHDLLGSLAHTPQDTLDVLDAAVLVDLAGALPELLALLRS